MKKLELKYEKEFINGQEHILSTLNVLKIAIENVPNRDGLSISEMSIRIKILDVLNENLEFDLEKTSEQDRDYFLKKTIEIEDSYYSKLNELMEMVQWKIVSRFILSLSEELKSQA